MTRVAMLVSNPFVFDPRVHAEARTLSESGYDVTVVAWDREGAYPQAEDRDGIHVRRVRVRSTFGQGLRQLLPFLTFWRQAIAVVSRERPAVVHCHDLDTLLAGLVVARRWQARLIYDSHECYPAMFTVHGGGQLTSDLLEAVERRLSKEVDALITVGQLLAARFREMTSKPVAVVGNWKRLREYRIDAERLRAMACELNVKDRLVISYIGGLGRSRVLLPLIEAVSNQPRWCLIVAGDGAQRGEVASLMEGMGNGVYLGKIPLGDVPRHVALSDVVYYGLDPGNLNNQYSAPNALFAALAAGKAVLTASVGEIAHIVREERCGIVLDDLAPQDIGQALERLADATFLRQCQQNAARAGESKYNWARAERILLSAYQDLAGSGQDLV